MSAKKHKRRNGSNGQIAPSVQSDLEKTICIAVEAALRHRGYAPNSHVGIIAETSYNGKLGKSPMVKTATKEPSKTNGVHKPFSRVPEVEGNGLMAICGRGLYRWREAKNLTVQNACETYGIERTLWYRIEGGRFDLTTARHFDKVCRAIGERPGDVLKLGTNEPVPR